MSARYNPFQELERVFDRMSRQFEEASRGWDTSDAIGRLPMMAESMRVDLVDEDDEFVLTVDVPGFERDDINIRLTDHMLTISAEREEHEEESDERYIRRERHRRSVRRSIELPEEVNEDDVDARMKNGVLTVSLPKKSLEESQTVEIHID